MKARHSVRWIGAFAVAVIAFAIWFAKKPTEAPSPTGDTTPPSGTQQHPVFTGVPTNPPASTAAPNAPAQTKVEQAKQGLATLNDEDIILYGKVVDQFNAPVVGAKVFGVIQVHNDTRVGTDRLSLSTDADGLFTVNGYRGKNLGITIKKEGYASATTNTSFIYSMLWPQSQRYVPDPNSPVVFKMWKLQGAEPLMKISQKYKIHYSATPIYFDLVAGSVLSNGGDLEITVNRPPGVISQQHPQDWSINIVVVNGGLIETSMAESRITYSAPEEGYQSDETFGNNNGPNWVDHMFFIKSRGGQVFGKIHLLFGINATEDGVMDISFRGEANTNASRNWEATASR